MVQVTWPDVQPSFSGGGEAPMAQEPQIQVPKGVEDTLADAAANDATKDNLEAGEAEKTPADTPMQVTEEEDAIEAGIDEDYVVDVTAVQATWDP